jgi:hypothetical protein
VVLLVAASACDDKGQADCDLTYKHLLKVAHRNHDPVAMDSFMTACRDAYDPKRLVCIREAATPGAALACKPQKNRPD